MPDEVRVDGQPGVVLTVLYQTRAESRVDYTNESQEIAELLWRRAEFRLERVLVEAANDTPWSAGRLPPPTVFERVGLEARFGARPSGLDDFGLGELNYGAFPEEDLSWALGFGIASAVMLALPFLFGGVTGGVVGFAIGRRRRDAWGSYTSPAYPGNHAPPTPWSHPGTQADQAVASDTTEPPGRQPTEDGYIERNPGPAGPTPN